MAGSVFLLPPGYWHRYRPDPETGWSEDWLELRGPTLDAWLGNGALDVAPVHVNRRGTFWRQFTELHDVCLAHQLGYRAIASGLAMTLLASVVSQSLASARTNKPDLPDLVRQARELLIQGRDVKSIARALELRSSSHRFLLDLLRTVANSDCRVFTSERSFLREPATKIQPA